MNNTYLFSMGRFQFDKRLGNVFFYGGEGFSFAEGLEETFLVVRKFLVQKKACKDFSCNEEDLGSAKH
jgi:hypothetical protein